MPLGVLDDHKLEHVPGTAPLTEVGHAQFDVDGVDTHFLKHDPTGKTVLVPQPSDSSNDPYNWPRWKKECFMLCLSITVGVVGASGPLCSPSFDPLSIEFGLPVQSFVGGIQSIIASNAVGSIFMSALAVKYGKRPIYLLCTVIMIVTSFWAAASKSFASLVAARTVMGFGMVPGEALISASISDVWFVHERGFRSSLNAIVILASITLSQPIAGATQQYGSWRDSFYAMGGACIILLILQIFLMPESAFHRVDAVNIDTDAKKLTDEVPHELKNVVEHVEVEEVPNESGLSASTRAFSPSEPTLPWTQKLLPYRGYVNHTPLWRTMYRPFVLLASMPVLWAMANYTISISLLIIVSTTLSQNFAPPPYLFSEVQIGLLSLAAFVGAMLGVAIAGPIIDGGVKKLSRWNKGTFEPEFRLPIMAIYLIFAVIGLFVFGQTISEGQAWPVPTIVGLGFTYFGIQLGLSGLAAYVIDCHRNKTTEAFAIMNFAKSAVSIIFIETTNNWIINQGVRNVFWTLGGITGSIALMTLPMYIFGKKARSWAHRHNIEGKL